MSSAFDYRELNKRTVKDSYPLPLLDEVQDRLHGATVFSTLDLQNGYWQLPVSEVTVIKLHSAKVQEWNFINFEQCPLAYVVLSVDFRE